jgi:RHS repeat-associated protein
MGFGERSRFRYGGHPQVPGTGLLDFGVRVYSPRLGRFLQPDPYVVGQPEAGLHLPRSLHPYAFVIGNPAALVDPHGAWFGSDLVDWGTNLVKDKFWGALKEGAGKVWEGIKEGAGKVWGGIEWAAGKVWEGVKWLGGELATLGTMFGAIADSLITWINPFTWLAYALDQSDSPVAGFFSFLVKFGRSPLTTLLGLGIGLYGLAAGKVEHVHFKKGTLVFEWNTQATFSGTVFGGTVHLWGGSVDAPDFKHETYHTYQYTGYGDLFLPAYAVGGTGGLLNSALAGDPQWTCFAGVSNNDGGGQSRGLLYGNPLELVAETKQSSANCR